jgi:hypothetical protein
MAEFCGWCLAPTRPGMAWKATGQVHPVLVKNALVVRGKQDGSSCLNLNCITAEVKFLKQDGPTHGVQYAAFAYQLLQAFKGQQQH